MTTRGMKEDEMRQVGRWIAQALNSRNDQAVLARIRKEVLALCESFPLYPSRRAHASVEAR
jgi:glycine hydroxymethyltransferase